MSSDATKKPAHDPHPAPAAPKPRKDDRGGDPDDHQGATEEQVSNQRGGSGAGYDLDPKKVPDKGGVAS